MIQIEDLRRAIVSGQLRISNHADEEMVADGLTVDLVLFATVTGGEIIESYPDDFPLPSCLVFGKTEMEEPIHAVWAYNELTRRAILVTVYRPDPESWDNWRIRKGSS